MSKPRPLSGSSIPESGGLLVVRRRSNKGLTSVRITKRPLIAFTMAGSQVSAEAATTSVASIKLASQLPPRPSSGNAGRRITAFLPGLKSPACYY
jgi:hypothetical protein